jgi:hypothetical protein
MCATAAQLRPGATPITPTPMVADIHLSCFGPPYICQ